MGSAPTLQEMESVVGGYPSATHMLRNERAESAIIIRYEFDTIDSKATVLKYYQLALLQKGFRDSAPRGGAIPSDVYYLRTGCPTYGVLLVMDEPSKHVIVELSYTPCR